jgi:DNA-binding LacI/PurR family transcriptional regulator
MGYHGAPSTIAERMGGYKAALQTHRLKPQMDAILHENPAEADLKSLDAFVCVNDRVAGELMHVFLAKGVRIPGDVRIVGVDDASYASLLPVPLTTVRQPTREIGEAALRTMLERIHSPHQPPREILLDGELVVRQSCGATSRAARR